MHARALAILCLLTVVTANASEASESEAVRRDYRYGVADNEWLIFLAEVGGQAGQYEYRLFGDGRLKWEHVHGPTRTVYDQGQIQLSSIEVADLIAFVVASGLIDVTRETWAELIGGRPAVTDSTTVVFQIRLESYRSTVRSEPAPFVQTVSVYGIPSKLYDQPDLLAVRALSDVAALFNDVAARTEEQGLGEDEESDRLLAGGAVRE